MNLKNYVSKKIQDWVYVNPEMLSRVWSGTVSGLATGLLKTHQASAAQSRYSNCNST